jgi:peroxiredoxin
MYPLKKIKRMCLILLLLGSLLLVGPSGCGKKEEPESEATTSSQAETKEDYELKELHQADTKQQAVETQKSGADIVEAEPPKMKAESKSGLKMDVLLKDAFQWKLLAKNWYGKWGGDFTLTDINGKVHKLSDYRGKDVIVLSWAVWCPGCQSQIAILNDIRERISEDKLAILAICYQTNTGRDTLEIVKEYAAKHKIGFPVFYVALDAVPSPFDTNLFVPASYFIDSRGNLKLAVEDIVSIKYVQKILQARR